MFLFFLLGFALFLLYTLIVAQIDRSERRITITPIQVELLTEAFAKTWNRPPTDEEIEGQIEYFIRDEVFFKEAITMGLDKSDLVVKRRMRQLIELMMDNVTSVYPSESQLNTYLSDNPDKFRQDPVISFQHIYFAENGREAAMTQLYNINNNLPVDENSFGNLSLLPSSFSNEQYFRIKRSFGEKFAESVFKLDSIKWQGPIKSAYGWHLVKVTHINPGYVPELSEIWDLVEREWSVEEKKMKKDQQYQKIKEKYIIAYENEE